MSDEQKGPAEPISAGLAPLYALEEKWQFKIAHCADSPCEPCEELKLCIEDLQAVLPDVATDLNFKINNWLGRQAREGLKK